MKNILVFCPMRVSPPRAYGRSVTSVLQLEWDHPVEYMLRDGKNPYDSSRDNVTAQYNWMRDFVLANDFDAVMTVEADVIVPPDALKRLVACDADIALGTYVFRRGRMEWSAHEIVDLDFGLSISEMPDTAKKLWGSVVDVKGVGLGCALITRSALEALGSFEPWIYKGLDCDWTMAIRAQELGLIQRADLGLVCGHITQTPSLRILWPDPTVPNALFRIDYLDDGWFEVTPDGDIQIIVDMLCTTHVTKQQMADAKASEKYRIAMSKE